MLAGFASSTMGKMFGGKTRKPKACDVRKNGRGDGATNMIWCASEAPDYENELPKAREQFKDHKAALAKAKARKR